MDQELCSLGDSIFHLSNLTSIMGRSTAHSIAAPFYRNSIWASHIYCFRTPFSCNHIKLYNFSLPHTAQILAWIILLDGSLVYKHIFFGVISVYKSISISDVEPFDSAKDFGGENFLL